MDSEHVRERLTEVFRDVFDDDTFEITRQLTAKDVEEWDSLSHIRLIVSAEQAFAMRFNTAEISSLENVGQFMDLIMTRLANDPPA